MTVSSTASKPKAVFIYDMPRTRSHLFFRYLCTHPDIQPHWHPYLSAHQHGPEKIHLSLSDEISHWRVTNDNTTYEMASNALREALNNATDKDKIFVSNEHVFICMKQEIELAYLCGKELPQTGNPTNIPDDIFEAAAPLFVIRHPVFNVRSLWKSMHEIKAPYLPTGSMWKLMTSFALQRQLFDRFYKQFGKPPILVDGDDIVLRPEEVAVKLCSALGISEKLNAFWDVTPESELPKDKLTRYFLKDISESTGIRRLDEAPEANLQKVHRQWVEEFGQETADQVEKLVQDMMPHYEYLKQFAL